jgi:polygalacturonase
MTVAAKRLMKHPTRLASAFLLALASFSALAQTDIHNPRVYGASGDGVHLDTKAIQAAIDIAAGNHAPVHLTPGTYLTGSLFLPSGTVLDIPEGVTLIGSDLNIEAATAGTIANAKNWTMADNTIKTADGSKITFTETPVETGKKDVPYGEPK